MLSLINLVSLLVFYQKLPLWSWLKDWKSHYIQYKLREMNKAFHWNNFLCGNGLLKLGAGLSFIHRMSLKEVLVYQSVVKMTCIIVCNDDSPRSRLVPYVSKRWPLKQHYQPINAFLMHVWLKRRTVLSEK